MSIRLKLFGITAAGILLLGISGGAGYWGITHLSDATAGMGKNTSILRNHLTADMMHDALSSDVMAALVASETGNRAELSNVQAALDEHADTFLAMLDENKELIQQQSIQNTLKDVLPTLNAYIESAREITTLASENREAALAKLPEFRSAYELLADRMEALTELIEASSASVESNAQQVGSRSNTLIVLTALVGILILSGIAWGVSSGITRALNRLVDGARAVADGDLTQPLRTAGTDEIAQTAQALEVMRQNLGDMVSSLNASAHRLGEASSTLNAVSRETHSGMLEQQSEIAQAATAMQEMASTAQDVSENIASAATAASQARVSSADANTIVENTISAMQSLAKQVEETAGVINQLDSDSGEISQILEVITSLADQTNLLALNAAIEAARAGEQGRGFAVVADEVRSLAARTQESTDQIKETIEKLQSGSGAAVTAMKKSGDRSKEVVDQARRAGESLHSIAASVDEINDMNTQIASAAEQQSTVADNISQSLEDINGRAQTTTESTERTSKAAFDVEDIARELEKSVKRFQV